MVRSFGGRFGGKLFALSLVGIAGLVLVGCEAGGPGQAPSGQADNDLVAATLKKDLEKLKAALDAGANPNLSAELLSKGPPIVPLAREDKAFVDALLAKGADVNGARDDGDTALITAAIVDNQEVVKLLLDKGADVNQQNKLGYTAVSEAVHRGHLEVVKLLVDKGADLNLGGRDGQHLPFDRALGKSTRDKDVDAVRVDLVKLIVEKNKPDQKRLDEAAKAIANWSVTGPNICGVAAALAEAGADGGAAFKAFRNHCPGGRSAPGPQPAPAPAP